MKILSTLIIMLLSMAVMAQVEINEKTPDKEINLSVNEGQEPDVYVDGRKYDSYIVGLIDPKLIESVEVLKDEKSLQKYNAPHGVIIVTTKDPKPVLKSKEKSVVKDAKAQLKSKTKEDVYPLIVIDGVESSRDRLEEIIPDDIESINVLKGEKAMQKYEAPNGVIEITLKKKNPKN